MKIYALTGDLRALRRDGRIELVHFPYDPGSRTRHIAPSATASDAQWRDLNTTWDELAGTWDDFAGSAHLPEIIRIIGPTDRRDALHIDSAYKTGCVAFVTADSDILDHKGELALLGVRFFHSDRDSEELRRFIADRCGSA